jgi:hypothetical protein
MLIWTIATCAYGFFVLGRIALRRIAEAMLRKGTSGVIIAVKESEKRTRFAGVVRVMHVIVMSPDNKIIMLTNPPYRQIIVGDMVVRGELVPLNDSSGNRGPV